MTEIALSEVSNGAKWNPLHLKMPMLFLPILNLLQY
ncbi:hypothetical protein V1278_000155 [Bradyrhizobium sp. AZCC 1577]